MDRARSWNVKINASVIVSGEWDSIRFTTGRSLDPSVSDSTYYDDWVRGLLSRKTYVDAYTQISRFCSRKEGREKKGREGRERNKKKNIYRWIEKIKRSTNNYIRIHFVSMVGSPVSSSDERKFSSILLYTNE